jgi:hypothetical protein
MFICFANMFKIEPVTEYEDIYISEYADVNRKLAVHVIPVRNVKPFFALKLNQSL